MANRYLVMISRVGMDVEWAYSFDVHLNAFFPVLMILHCLQLFLINREFTFQFFYITDGLLLRLGMLFVQLP